MKKLIEKQLIQGNAVGKSYHTSLENIDYRAIHCGFRNDQYSSDCFKEEEIFLTENITDHLYKGNQLFYYPFLAKQMRKLEAYPCLNKKYPIDKEKKGIEFLNYLFIRKVKITLNYKDLLYHFIFIFLHFIFLNFFLRNFIKTVIINF